MDFIVPVFQYEIRFNHILNFSQIARNMLAPYVKLTQSIKIDKQNTLEETYFLNFEEDEYLIIISWDRIVFKGQGSLDVYLKKNSPLAILFFDIFDQINSLKEFGQIQKSLFYGISICKNSDDKFDVTKYSKNILSFNPQEVIADLNDVAVVLEAKTVTESKSATFGPYWGSNDILKRPIGPVNIVSLGDLDFEGIMFEYKSVKVKSEVNFNDFTRYCSEFNGTFKKICQI